YLLVAAKNEAVPLPCIPGANAFNAILVIMDCCRFMPRSATIIAGLFGVFLLSFGCGSDPSAKPAGPPAFPVKVISIQPQLVPQSTDYLATLKSRNSAVLQPQVEGDIIKIYVQAGQRVDAGTPILQIDPRKQEAAVNNQEAARRSKQAMMEQNRVDLER